ncbi:hypothetical protein BW723_11015 [Polaribacter reichenbachii]|uniref:Uncharacterized protein n=1 Tax=Polaribacter reichenbachii TaxID=996801 RepID=A0A1B8TQ56_9FLAO|nr:hypothetical protein [Polaribacter reichenbachii]APZ46780.1 hypothetical protein BW723_11015 [Polaribacter reichenbachii]AUC17423.1 hypothetical protein BTO17_01460 [Polaribacter reichenbachii]OBY61702.1 hypothetical protein LPB301_16745 [Polaribacter reichenbachii]
MKIYNYLAVLFFISILYSCDSPNTEEGIEGTILCDTSEIGISASDNVVFLDNSESVLWQGNYSDSTVNISFTKDLNDNNTTETLNFVFNKIEDCLQIDRGFEFYDGSTADISAITQVYVLEVTIQDWEVDEKFSGQIIYRDHHDKLIKTHNFWVEFTADDYVAENTNNILFADCFADKLPIDLDLDNDGTTDYTILADDVVDFANSPNFVAYKIKLVSTDESINEILSPRGVSIPFPVIFEPPFSTDNTRSYDANKFNSVDIRNSLDVFYEFSAPYESYNFFLQNNLTYKKEFANNLDDYYAVRLIRNDENFYGWIKIEFDALNCEIAILDTYLSPNAEEHITIEN